jgi:hypothetical protein
MSTDGAGISDDVQAQTFSDADADDMAAAEDAREATEQPPAIPDRPADGAAKAKWVDYCVALGADRTFLTEDTEHGGGGADGNERITEPALTRDQLIELATRLGG